MLESLERFVKEAQQDIGNVQALAKELDGLVRPTAVLNISTGVVHAVERSAILVPDIAVTRCGWRWARSPLCRPVLAEDVARAAPPVG